MSKVVPLNTTKARLARMLQDATPAPSTKSGSRKKLHITAIICLLGAMLPFQVLSAFFCIAFLMTTVISIQRRLLPSRSQGLFIAAVATASIITGCSPALFDSSREDILTLCAPGPECKIGYAQGLRVMGIDVISVTIEDAIANGDIEEIKVAQYKEGFGLISLTRIQAYGS